MLSDAHGMRQASVSCPLLSSELLTWKIETLKPVQEHALGGIVKPRCRRSSALAAEKKHTTVKPKAHFTWEHSMQSSSQQGQLRVDTALDWQQRSGL